MSDILREDSPDKIGRMLEKERDMKSVGEIYHLIDEVLRTYMDLPEDDRKIITLWALAVSFKSYFATMPYLFINASKGSGKTRLLKILENIIPRSILTPNLTEASLKRLPSQNALNALLIDEAERLTSKEKLALKELLNAAYKKGGKVLLVEESKGERVVKQLPVFLGVALANIWGLESVLEDRCITLILEKSKDPRITKIPEYFNLDDRFSTIKKSIGMQVVYVGSVVGAQTEFLFNSLLRDLSYTTYTHTLLTQPTLLHSNNDFLYKKVVESPLTGRDLELWLPLLIISYLISDEFFLEIMDLAKTKSEEKAEEQVAGDRDTVFASFLYYYLEANGQNGSVTTKNLKKKHEEVEGEKIWMSSEWIGRCLRRLKVIKQQIRKSNGMLYYLEMNKLKKYLDIRGVNLEEEVEKSDYVDSETQMTLKEKPDKEDFRKENLEEEK